ncbi:MAG: MFS transporter [Lautropia sp.]|nr:MFS transporter [Lautropia sp.]
MRSSNGTDAEPMSRAQRWWLLAMVGLGLLLVTLDITILLTALPTMARDIGASAAEGLWIINAYPLVSTGLLLGAGTLGDRVGHRRMFLLGLVIFGLASLLAACSGTVGWLIVARVLQAIGAAAMLPATLALIRQGFADERERALAISIWASLSLIGAILGPLLGGFLLAHFHWGAIFLINVPIIALVWVGTWFCAPHNHATDEAHPWDSWSSVLGLLTLSSLVAAIKTVAHSPVAWPLLAAALITVISAGLAFVRRQRRLAYPLLDFALFRNPVFSAGVLGAVCVTFTTAGLLLAVSQRYQWVAGYTPWESGLLVSALFLGTLPSSILGGACLHRVGLRPLIAGGLAVGASGVSFSTLGLAGHVGWLVGGLVLAGLGLGATVSVASTAIIESAPLHRAGMASSVEEVSYEFGALLAIALLGSLLNALYPVFMVLPPGIDASARESIATAVAMVEHSTGVPVAGAGSGSVAGTGAVMPLIELAQQSASAGAGPDTGMTGGVDAAPHVGHGAVSGSGAGAGSVPEGAATLDGADRTATDGALTGRTVRLAQAAAAALDRAYLGVMGAIVAGLTLGALATARLLRGVR